METRNEEMWKRRNDQGLPCSRHVLSGRCLTFILVVIQMTSSAFLHSIVQSMAESKARLGTNSFARVKGPKARSLDKSFDGAKASACLASFLGVPV